MKEDREIQTLKVWCCVGKASSLDTAAFLYSWGGTHWEGEEMQGRAVELLGPDKHMAILEEK